MKLRRIIGWTLAILVIVIGIGVFGGYFYLRSNAFHQFAIRKIVDQANQATGGRTQIGSLDFKLSTLTAHLYNVVIRGNESHEAAAKQHGITPIDLVVVNLYPFEETIAKPNVSLHDAIENIDIGGPSMLRSAAKNHEVI